MDTQLISKIAGLLNKKSKDSISESPYFPDKGYKPFELSSNNFHQVKESASDKKLCFIDGGNASIITTPDLSLQLIRVYYTVYMSNRRLRSKKIEFFALISPVEQDSKICYRTELFDSPLSLDKNSLSFDPLDPTIRAGIHKAKIESVGGIIRRFSELNAAESALDLLGPGDILVLDGTLQASVTHESIYLNRLYAEAAKKGITVSGLSKTNTILTNKGNSLSASLDMLAPKAPWYYHPIADTSSKDHLAELFFIKLNERSKYCFRFEICKNHQFDIDQVLSHMIKNSSDPVFIGYPYGLIEADRFARISNEEKASLKFALRVKLDNNFSLKSGISAIDAHEILDNIS